MWTGVSDDGYSLASVLPQAAVLGTTQTAMRAAQAGVWDRGPALRVVLAEGTLSSRTVDEVLGGANAALIGDGSVNGWEVFQFATAILVAPNTYDLSLRLRGQAGSDGIMMPAWPIGSQFVLINSALQQVPMPASARGVQRHYRVGRLSSGYNGEFVLHETHAFAGNGLRPYRVAHLRAAKTGHDVVATWVRRTRIDGDSWDSVEVPVGETSEAYVVRISQGSSLLRQDVVGAASYTYTQGMQADDGAVGPIIIDVAQRSDAYGAGPYQSIAVDL